MNEQIIFYTQAYNAEQYLEKAIVSILNQTYKNFLYYIVDDGSSDKTRSIIQKYASIDSRIIPIYNEKNTYLTCYNNTLQKIYSHHDATFFAFLDADDWYEPTFAEKGIEALKSSNTELYICGSIFETPSEECIGKRAWQFDKNIFSTPEIVPHFTLLHSFFRTCWAKIYYLDILRKHDVFVPTTLPVGFDTGFFFQYLTHIKNFFLSSDTLHHYLVDPNSTSYRYIPNRPQCDMELATTTLTYLESIDGDTEENRFFLGLINLHAFKDTFKVALSAYHDNKMTENELFILLNSDFLSQIKATITELLPYYPKYQESIEYFKTEVVNFMLDKYQTKDNRVFYTILTSIVPTFSTFYDESDIKEFLSPFDCTYGKIQYLLRSPKAVLQFFSEKPLTSYTDSDIKLIGLLQLCVKQEFSTLAYCIKNYYIFSDKQKNYILNSHPFLSKIEDSIRLFYYPNILQSILEEDYELLIRQLPQLTADIFSSDTKTSLVFARVGTYIAAFLSMEEYYIFFLKAELELLYELKRIEEAKEKFNELFPLLPNDEELLELKEKIMA